MNIESIKLPVTDLTKGMVVIKLDRPWLETPFKMQGFRIGSQAELRQLAKYCKHVYVDSRRGVAPPIGKGERVLLTMDGEVVNVTGVITGAGSTSRPSELRVRAVDDYALPSPGGEYPVGVAFDVELPQARAAVAATKTAMRELMQQLQQRGVGDLGGVKAGIGALEESMLRNPDPALLLRALAADEPFSHRHCVNSTILAIALGRELGLKRQPLHELAMGVLLADIGKTQLPPELLRTARRLTRKENEIMKLHVAYGVEMARAMGGLTPGTIELIGSHHERFNGSGYPDGLVGGELSLAARIAGLADTFDAITSERTYSSAIPVHEAMQELYAATVEIFQRELVERFFQALGTYPVGTVVALSDGALALVLAQNRQRRLLPRVLRLTDANRQPLAQTTVLDLVEVRQPALTVREVVDPAACGLAQPTAAVLPA